MGQIIEYISIAIMNIKHNRGRSILTMLGIIIGISSVILVISIGNGVKNQINKELEDLAGGQITFYVDSSKKDATVKFDEDDIQLVTDKVAHVKGVTQNMNYWGTVNSPKFNGECILYCGTPALQYNGRAKVIKGRFFDDSDYQAANNVCVINENQAKMMFGSSDVVGLTFDITLYGTTQEFKVIGVREVSSGSLLSALGDDTYIEASIPLTTASEKFGIKTDEVNQIVIFSEGPLYSKEVAKKAKNLLEAKHHASGTNQIMVQSFEDQTSQFNTILGAITAFVSLVAAISLIVGGIGVMNIMLVSVTERTREIGIRKALGARTNSIMWQFLAEAGIITLLGGIIGIIFGVVGAILVCAVLKAKAAISPMTIIMTSLFSCGIGIFFGIYPAKKAAQLSPIEALRHE